jgi:hypothetical protein
VFGFNGRLSQVRGHAFLSPIIRDTSEAVMFPMVSLVAYRADLHRRFRDYRRTSFASEGHVFEPRPSDGKSPTVFLREFAERNILLPPTGSSDVAVAVTAMIRSTDRHRHFASMASSQALAQSVFGGLAALGRLNALESLLANDNYPAFFEGCAGYQLTLEHKVSTLGEPRPTSLDVFIDGPRKVAVEVKFSEPEFGRCSRPGLTPDKPKFARDHCDGTFSVQRNRLTRCSLLEQGILYWQFVPQVFTWSGTEDHRPCPLALPYQLVRNVLGICIGEDGRLDTGRGHVLVVYDERNPAFRSGGDGDAAWWATIRALRFPRLLRRISWQRVASHLAQFPRSCVACCGA